MENVNLDNVTIEDAVDMYFRKGMCAICNDGKLMGFEPKEKSTLTNHEKSANN